MINPKNPIIPKPQAPSSKLPNFQTSKINSKHFLQYLNPKKNPSSIPNFPISSFSFSPGGGCFHPPKKGCFPRKKVKKTNWHLPQTKKHTELIKIYTLPTSLLSFFYNTTYWDLNWDCWMETFVNPISVF